MLIGRVVFERNSRVPVFRYWKLKKKQNIWTFFAHYLASQQCNKFFQMRFGKRFLLLFNYVKKTDIGWTILQTHACTQTWFFAQKLKFGSVSEIFTGLRCYALLHLPLTLSHFRSTSNLLWHRVIIQKYMRAFLLSQLCPAFVLTFSSSHYNYWRTRFSSQLRWKSSNFIN